MAVAFDAFSTPASFSSYVDSLTWAHTCSGSDRVLIVGIVGLSDVPPPHDVVSVTYNGVAMTKIGEQDNAGVHTELWRLVAPATGANNVVITLDGSFDTSWLIGMAKSFTGVDQTTPIDVHGGAVDTVNAVSRSLTTTGANEMLIDVGGKYSTADALVANGGQTASITNTGGAGWGLYGAMSHKAAAAAGSHNTGYTYSDSNDGAMYSAALKEAAAAAVNKGAGFFAAAG